MQLAWWWLVADRFYKANLYFIARHLAGVVDDGGEAVHDAGAVQLVLVAVEVLDELAQRALVVAEQRQAVRQVAPLPLLRRQLEALAQLLHQGFHLSVFLDERCDVSGNDKYFDMFHRNLE